MCLSLSEKEKQLKKVIHEILKIKQVRTMQGCYLYTFKVPQVSSEILGQTYVSALLLF